MSDKVKPAPALTTTENPRVMMHPVTFVFYAFRYPYSEGAWSESNHASYEAACKAADKFIPQSVPTLPAAPPPPPAAPVAGHKPPAPAPMPMAQAPAPAPMPLPVGAKAPPPTAAEYSPTDNVRLMKTETGMYLVFLSPYKKGALAAYMCQSREEANMKLLDLNLPLTDQPDTPADVLNLPFPAPKQAHERIHQGFDDYHDQGSECIAQLLDLIEGDHAEREGLADTPKRVVKAWKEWTSGYNIDIAALLKVFEDGAENYDEMVVVKDIPIYSKCEHHLADIFGTATIAYIPNGKVVGLSKISRVADAFARRLQVQERLTTQIADALVEHLQPLGVGVVIKARHMCMESRGICQQGHHTVTSALRGVIKDQSQTRAEFLALANS